MLLTADTGQKRDLTSAQMAALDAKLRSRIPSLVGWTYSPITGELTLDFGDSEDSKLLQNIQDWLVKADGNKVVRFEILELIKEWVE